MDKVILQKENFNDFKVGEFPYDPKHSAMGEYHYYPPKGYRGNWYCPITDFRWRGPMWIVTCEGGRKIMESTVIIEPSSKTWNMLTTGDPEWDDYTVELEIRVLNTASVSGIAFRYQDSRCFHSFCFEDGKAKFIKRRHEEYEEMAAVDFPYDADHIYRLKIECKGSIFSCYVDNAPLFTVTDSSFSKGRISLCATSPVQFSNVIVWTTEECHSIINRRKKEREEEISSLTGEYPKPELWKAIDLKDFGAGRNIRFGDLSCSGSLDILIAQCQQRVRNDCYANISCLTAIDLDGNVMWQIGAPNPKHAFLTADLPFQIADVDMDGENEVIIAKDFKIMILDGKTGKIKNSLDTPVSDSPYETLYGGVPYGRYAFDRVNIDCIRICNFTGRKTPTDILVKDRYSRLWAYDNELNLLWKFHDGITGHFPFTKDINGDGREEMLVGYNLVDAEGNKIWTLPIETDHTDEIIIGKIDPEFDGEKIGLVCGDEGFVLADLEGNILVKDIVGHAQRISTGNYRPDLPGLEIAVTTYWGHQGIVLIYNCKGERLYSFEPGTDGNIVSPVNWKGDGTDLILLNGNIRLGGMIDGWGRRVVAFPDDGHPDLCAEVIDLTGDCRDEIVLWDNERMFIYTQDTDYTEVKIYCPDKYHLYNASNYRGEYSWPGWKANR